MRRRSLCDGWEFTREYDEKFITGEGVYEVVDLPHTVAETPFNAFDESVYQGVFGYRKRISVPAEMKDKRLFVTFMGAAHEATVYANGVPITTHRCGYTAFEVELTPFVQKGEALLAVRLDTREDLDQPPFGFVIDYMTYGGLYREVYAEYRDAAYIDDVFVIPDTSGMPQTRAGQTAKEIEALTFDGRITARIRVVCDPGQTPEAAYRIFDENGRQVANGSGAEVIEREEGGVTLAMEAFVPGARLWDALSPRRYRLEVQTTWTEGRDERAVTFGFRRAEFREDGFYLNGRYFKLRGLNRHQSWPYVGYAMPASQQRLDADILKNELGVNAVRTSHYPQSQHFIDRCDELGLLVFTEIPGWQHIGGARWQDQAVENVREMVTQYRNHPSIVLWGVRINESTDNDELYKRTNAAAHGLDPTRQTGGVRCIKKSNLLEDVYTYNDFVHSGGNKGCEKKKNVTSDETKGYLVSEYGGHMFPTKAYDDEEHRLAHALRHAAVIDAVAGEGDVAGSFGWCMFDYNTHCDFGSGDRICYHGVLDMYRNPKFAAAVYAAEGLEEPVLEISSSMEIGEHPASVRGHLYAVTNGDAVRVYKNGEFIKEFPAKSGKYAHMAHPPVEIDDLIGDHMNAEGFPARKTALIKKILNEYAVTGGKNLSKAFYLRSLRATLFHGIKFEDAYALYGKYLGNWGDRKAVYRFEAVKDGKVVRSVEKTPMTEVILEARPDRNEIVRGETFEVVSVRLRALDEHGNLLTYLCEPVEAKVEGALDFYGSKEAALRGGMGGLYLRTTGTGEAKLTLTLRGRTRELTFTVRSEQT